MLGTWFLDEGRGRGHTGLEPRFVRAQFREALGFEVYRGLGLLLLLLVLFFWAGVGLGCEFGFKSFGYRTSAFRR